MRFIDLKKNDTIVVRRDRPGALFPADPVCEKHLHGEIVSFGVLCLLTYDNQTEERDGILDFNRSIGLPVTMEQIGLIEVDLPVVAKKTSSVVEWEYAPGNPTEKSSFGQFPMPTGPGAKRLPAAVSEPGLTGSNP